MSKLHPLRFRPLFRRAIWGGQRLQTLLAKRLGEGDDFAESWEVVDHGEDQSVVLNGDLTGTTLGELVAQDGQALFGKHVPTSRFPLLFKFLDANRRLSVQVHPNDQLAAKLDPPDLGKTEAWVVLAAKPGSVVYAGLRRGFDRPALEREVARGTTELCLHKIEPSVGDCILLHAGVLHALGEGLVIAEIQQSSDTTFRLFDWNRVGADGKPRQLHVEQALNSIDFDRGPLTVQTPKTTEMAHVWRLAECDKFVLDRWHFETSERIGGDDRFHIVAVLQGAIDVAGDPSEEPLSVGQVMLLPAAVGQVELRPRETTALLDMYLP